ncbi:MAG: PrgI family protein [Candidatus Wildermuthbacteria bacterium]|nr:PrgI family protein [Candidatus Wildermuthbacteria bacterium]
MRFTVPQFIEYETKVVGPLTFRQFIFVGIASGAIFVLYFYVGKTNFFLFMLLAILLMGIALILAFLKIGGRGLPILLENSLKFIVSPRIYIWKKGEQKVEVFKKIELKKETGAGASPLRVGGESRLKKLGIQIETKK